MIHVSSKKTIILLYGKRGIVFIWISSFSVPTAAQYMGMVLINKDTEKVPDKTSRELRIKFF
jgi:hypothetical protein